MLGSAAAIGRLLDALLMSPCALVPIPKSMTQRI